MNTLLSAIFKFCTTKNLFILTYVESIRRIILAGPVVTICSISLSPHSRLFCIRASSAYNFKL